MPAKTTVFDGQRYCTGYCGRLLPLDWFYLSGKGYYMTWCKPCAKVKYREWYRKKYRSDSVFWRKEKRKSRERYRTNTAYRESRLAYWRERYARKKAQTA